MASTTYTEIVQRLDRLTPGEVWQLLGEIQGRIKSSPKHSLKDFKPKGPLRKKGSDWVSKLRGEWDEP